MEILVKKSVENLKSSSSTTVETTLLKIRTKIISSSEGLQIFRENNGLECLLPLIRKPNERVLDITLSILGNCCLDDECSMVIGNLNIYGPTVTILKTVCKDSILGRACRVAGNLSQNKCFANHYHNAGIVTPLVELIDNRDKNTSNPTLSMAVRALSKLWTVIDKREEMLTQNSVNSITKLMIANCETAGLFNETPINKKDASKEFTGFHKSQGELINSILKCLAYVTIHITPQCAEQICGEGKGYKSLVELTKFNEPLALKCLLNLCYLSSSRIELGKVGLIECLVRILQDKSVSSWPEAAPRALAHLSSESVNRSRLLHSGGLTLLVAAAKSSPHAMHALLQYVFDEKAFDLLVKEGLMTILTDQLKDYLATMEMQHDCLKEYSMWQYGGRNKNLKRHTNVTEKKDTKRMRRTPWSPGSSSESGDTTSLSPTSDDFTLFKSDGYFSTRSDGEQSGFSPEYRSESKLKRPTFEWSPESGCYSSEGGPLSPSSPTSSGVTSPTFSTFAEPSPQYSVESESCDSDISGRYSPVCSDNDDEKETTQEANDDDSADDRIAEMMMQEFDELIMEDDVVFDEEVFLKDDITKVIKTSDSSQVACILVLMQRVYIYIFRPPGNESCAPMPLDVLVNKDCISSLFDYLEKCSKPTGCVSKILSRILSNPLCIISLLKLKIPLRLHQTLLKPTHKIQTCGQCKQIAGLYMKYMKQIRQLVESNYAIGEICYHFLHPTSELKLLLAQTLPYIVKKSSILKKYYFDCNGMNILLDTLNGSMLNLDVLDALAKLAQILQIKNPGDVETCFKTYNVVSDFAQKQTGEDIVTFELDDASTVVVNKTLLCENSEVFTAMLLGSFKESSEDTVRLRHVSQQSLQYLLFLLFYGYNESSCKRDSFPLAEELDLNLETLLLADRYLLNNLKVFLHRALVQFRLNTKTVNRIYMWSLTEGGGFLCVESVAFLLTGVKSKFRRMKLFREMLDMGFKGQYLDDIKKLYLQHLTNCSI